MMGRNTRPSTTRLWTGLATLLLITGLVSSQDPSTLSVASSPNAEAITERLSGSVASLRNVDSISDVASTTLKSVKEIPESSINRTKVDESPDGLTTESNVAHKVERLLENKSEKLKVKEPPRRPQASDVAEEKKQSTNGSLQEFSENEDNEKIEDLEDDNDREPTTRPPKKEKPKEKIPEIGVSLLNDTNVNYNDKKSVKNTKDEGVFGEDSDNPKNTLENATNVIVSGGEAADDNGKGKGPKSQVEVVKNSTLPKVLRISEAEVVEERKDVDSLGSAEQEVNKTIANNANLWSTNLTNASEKSDNSTLGNRENVEGDRNEDKKASQSPKGRTISFGGTNEFITNDNKTEGLIRDNEGINDNSSNEMTSSVTKEAIREEISTDFKPYPYVKTNFHPNSTSILSSGSLEIRESTEEAAALENTIGQSKENKKIVVTEASVVIDNSIQHFKPTYYKRSGNVTRIASTSDITKATAVPSLGSEEASSTTLSSNPLALENATTIFLSSLPLSNTENDVPRGNEASESSGGLKETNSSVDIIGNGITEIVAGIKNISVVEFNATTASLPLPSSSVSQTRATEQISVQNSTEIIGTSNEEVTLADFDTQTIAGLSMTNISAFNVTEGSSGIGSNQSDTNDVESTSALSITTLMPDTSSQLISTSVNSSLSTSGAFNTTSMSPLVGNDSSESNSNEQNSGATITETSTISMTILNVSADSNPIDYSESTAIPTTASMSSKVTSSTSLTTEGSDNSTYFASEEPTDAISTTTPKTVESFGPNDQLESTTSNIEYVFVGLTESTASQRYIATSESSNAVTLDSELSSSTSSNVIEASTFSQTSDVGSTTIGMTNSSESFLATEQPEQSSEEPNVTKLTVENDTNLDSTTILSYIEVTTLEDSTISEFDTTTIVPDLATIFKNESVDSTTEQIIPTTNSTNSSEIISDSNENSTDTGRGVDSFTTVPNVTGSKVENVSETIIGSSERSNISNTSESPELSVSTTIPNANFTLETPAINSTSEKSIKDQIVNNDETNSNFSESATKTTTSLPKSDIDSTSEDANDVVTDDAIEITARGVPSLVKVVFDGSWADVCPHLDALRQSLADLLTTGLEKSVLASQIIFQNNPCSEGFEASAITTESSITTLLLYVVDEKGNFDSEMTKTLPSLYSKSPIKLQVNIRSFQLVQDSDSGNAIAVVVVSCVALICLVVLAGLLFIMRKRQTRFNYGERCRPVSLDAYSLDSVSAYNSVRRKGAARASKRSYGNPTFEDSSAIPSHPLNFAGLSTFCNEQNAISEEFAGIPQVTARIDELPQGAEVKNRYANVVPLPETRVSLIKINNDPLTEYINASYVRGPKNATKYYIACQAPIESTVTDFWRMIWEQQSKVVIMLTDLVENGVEKCAEYIPPSEVTDCHRLFGDFQVTLKKRETKEKYAISTLHLKNLENNTFREISHIWYLWPANGVQSDAAGLIAVLLEARALQRGGPGPIVVHCSPGTGRTGTLIALDLGIRQYEITRTVDVPRVVYTIRRDRAGAVQTKEQYAFIYKALNLYATKLAGGALES